MVTSHNPFVLFYTHHKKENEPLRVITFSIQCMRDTSNMTDPLS